MDGQLISLLFVLEINLLMFLMLNLLFEHRYDATGNTHGEPEMVPPTPTRLSWDFENEELLKTIGQAQADAQKVLNVSQIKWLII